MDDDVHLYFEIAKAAPDGSFVRGWACVTTHEDGSANHDWDGEVMPLGEVLQPAVHDFMSGQRVAKVMHNGTPTGEVVESVLIDDDFAKEMGMTTKKRGWWAGMRVHDEAARKGVRERTLKGFSLGGKGNFADLPGA